MFKRYLYPPAMAGALLALTFFCAGIIAQEAAPPAKTYEPAFALVEQYPSPVIARTSPGTEDNEYGFEGGRVVKVEGTYHLVTTEMSGEPMWVKTRIAHWTSPDRIHWKRVATLYESSGDYTGQDPRAALWGPMFVYNTEEGRWDLIYVAYRCAPNTKTEWRNNYEGRIWRAVSKQKGYAGIGGPYEDAGVILEPDANSQPWEGLQGTDSFFPYQVGKRWLGFYGSANTEHLPMQHWRVGLAEAPALAGPWKRLSEGNPVNIEKRFRRESYRDPAGRMDITLRYMMMMLNIQILSDVRGRPRATAFTGRRAGSWWCSPRGKASGRMPSARRWA